MVVIRRKQGNVLFNDALNTFYFTVIWRRLTAGFFYMHHPTDRIAHTTAFVTPVVEHWLEREIAQWVCMNDGMYVCVCMYACMYLYVYVCMYARIPLTMYESQVIKVIAASEIFSFRSTAQ